LQWLKDPSEINGDNLNIKNVKPAGISGIKKKQYLKDKTDGLATNNKNKNIIETCIEESMTLIGVTNLEVTQ
jgi:hypothetical protein